MTTTANATDRSTVKQLITTVQDLQETVRRQSERIDELEEELTTYRADNERDKAEIRQKITTVENRAIEAISEDTTSTGDSDTESSQPTETPLERMCAIPAHVAERELTANQKRARFIARDIHDYAENVPAGLVIDSRTIKRVLTAAEGQRPHTQTVARVMTFLTDLGKDDVQLKKRRGKKIIVVSSEATDRLTNAANHDRCDRGRNSTYVDGVISSE